MSESVLMRFYDKNLTKNLLNYFVFDIYWEEDFTGFVKEKNLTKYDVF